ncbi:RNA polymerase sigma factor [Denitromonas ohlonensis]|uniref:Sigma-70 family RNA polymerase sigma factor n=2 Tax=Denitromonas TaxID=139331 RepID=A0A557RPD7_9RHOO|nr:sigma-70 family RNA polymerase sigma factor [Denitromonas ohlonensis]TVO67041.1 sigma-70 family RNA polymerase sigma factor [Denitromonas ohlonensis]TVO79101.1 sigma-70 family RNA polymerase sigma factor [Denitromonas ohlonensis]
MRDEDALREAAEIARARAGDTGAFAALVCRYQDRVFGFVLRMIGVREEAMELTQDVFLKAWTALPDWRPEARLSTWLLQIARNAALDVLRRRERVGFTALEALAEVADTAPGPDENYAGRQRQGRLIDALAQIAPEHREILLLREIEDLSYAELGATLGLSEGTVKSRLARARAALLARYRPFAGDADD